MRGGTSADGGKTVRWPGGPRSRTLERSAATDVRFQPGTTTILDFRLVEATTPTNQRPDLGIGGDDVAIDKHGVTLTVHSLGARPVAGGTARLEAADGRVLATAPIPAPAAPHPLEPHTVPGRLASTPSGRPPWR